EHGLTKLGDLLQATAVSWQGCYFRPELGCIDSEDALGELMSSAFQNVAGETWNDFRERWRAQIQALLDDHLPEVDAASLEELTELIKVMDYAISSDDAEAYRAIMDGFYCDEENEAERMDAANRLVTRIDRTTTTILSAHPIGR